MRVVAASSFQPSDTMNVTEQQPPRTDAEPTPSASKQNVVYEFESLADGQRMILIRYRDNEYRLTATKTGKLVLNK